MAFRLPTQAPPRRHTSYSNSQPPALNLSTPDPDPTTEWVLFSPSQPSTTARTHTTSTERTPRTAGVSGLSDFGSFGTPTRSAFGLGGDDDEEPLDEPLDEDGTELDSLDDGLHAFRAPSLTNENSVWEQSTPAVLPAHDGLGSFQAPSQAVQEQLWQHEQYNPRRRPELRLRRHSSVQRVLDAAAENENVDVERDRWQRIEKWRMDQSRALLYEIEKETRRRRRSSRASQSTAPVSHPVPELDHVPETPNGHSSTTAEPDSDDESFWRRITRKVIRDLIGIDDSLLSVIFGESLPPTEEEEQSSTTGTEKDLDLNSRELDSVPDQDLWQGKLLQRIAHELGILVHQLCEHPGAFTSYLNLSNDILNEYAGIPVRSREDNSQSRSGLTALTTSVEMTNDTSSILSPHFAPTLRDPNKEHAAHWGIEDEDMGRDPLSESVRIQQEKEYWERELDVMMVFRYLRNRFTRRNSNPDTGKTARRNSQDPSHRAAIIRQHHPLVARAHSRSQAQGRRQSQFSGVSGVSGSARVSSPLVRQQFRRPSSSCASQSAKLSAISSRRTLTGSSRNYWDIGGSVESGSAIAPVGGLGTWGDV